MKNCAISELLIQLTDKCADAQNKIKEKFGLTDSEYKCICVFESGESVLKCEELAGKMKLSVSRASRVISNMTKKKYLSAVTDKTNRRCLKIKLTAAGMNIKKKIDNMKSECEEKILFNLPESQHCSIRNNLKLLINSFQNKMEDEYEY